MARPSREEPEGVGVPNPRGVVMSGEGTAACCGDLFPRMAKPSCDRTAGLPKEGSWAPREHGGPPQEETAAPRWRTCSACRRHW